MTTQNKKFRAVLLAGLFIGGAVAFGYACGGDDTSPAVNIPKVDGGGTGTGGTGGSSMAGGGGNAGAGVGGNAGAGVGGNAGVGVGGNAGAAGAMMVPCQASGTFDNVAAKTVFPTDGGVPTF